MRRSNLKRASLKSSPVPPLEYECSMCKQRKTPECFELPPPPKAIGRPRKLRCTECKQAEQQRNRDRLGNQEGLAYVCALCQSEKKPEEFSLLPVKWTHSKGLICTGCQPEGTKYCRSCKEIKPVGAFYYAKRRADGLESECADCTAIRNQGPRARFALVKGNARQFNREFSLSFTYFHSFWDTPCTYCRRPMEGIGLDRVDSSRGYVVGNVVQCCWTCNTRKRDAELEEFLLWTIHVAETGRRIEDTTTALTSSAEPNLMAWLAKNRQRVQVCILRAGPLQRLEPGVYLRGQIDQLLTGK